MHKRHSLQHLSRLSVLYITQVEGIQLNPIFVNNTSEKAHNRVDKIKRLRVW